MARRQDIIACSFCGKRQSEVRHLIAGPNGVFICDECVALCNEILETERNAPTPTTDDSAPSRPPST